MAYRNFETNQKRIGIAPSEKTEVDEWFLAKKLIKMIFEDLNPEDFTFTDVEDAFGEYKGPDWTTEDRVPKARGKGRRVHIFQRSHLDALLKESAIAESSKKGHFHVTSVGRMLAGE